MKIIGNFFTTMSCNEIFYVWNSISKIMIIINKPFAVLIKNIKEISIVLEISYTPLSF